MPEADVTAALGRVPADQRQAQRSGQALAGSLLDELTRAGSHEIDTLLSS